jgi:ATP-dependent Clp protease ATP-binding subunit ClpB
MGKTSTLKLTLNTKYTVMDFNSIMKIFLPKDRVFFQLFEEVAEHVQEMGIKFTYEQIKSAVMEMVTQHFRPEFINRIDETVVFHSLAKEQIAKIAQLQINYLHKRLKEQNINLAVTPEAIAHLAEAGYDPVYGARPLKRTIQQKLENPLANSLLKGQFKPGETIKVSYENEHLEFK